MSYQTSENSAIQDTGPLALDAGIRPHRYHIGRSWAGTEIEQRCRCRKAACGLVDTAFVDPNCDQHAFRFARTIRQTHHHYDCPADG